MALPLLPAQFSLSGLRMPGFQPRPQMPQIGAMPQGGLAPSSRGSLQGIIQQATSRFQQPTGGRGQAREFPGLANGQGTFGGPQPQRGMDLMSLLGQLEIPPNGQGPPTPSPGARPAASVVSQQGQPGQSVAQLLSQIGGILGASRLAAGFTGNQEVGGGLQGLQALLQLAQASQGSGPSQGFNAAGGGLGLISAFQRMFPRQAASLGLTSGGIGAAGAGLGAAGGIANIAQGNTGAGIAGLAQAGLGALANPATAGALGLSGISGAAAPGAAAGAGGAAAGGATSVGQLAGGVAFPLAVAGLISMIPGAGGPFTQFRTPFQLFPGRVAETQRHINTAMETLIGGLKTAQTQGDLSQLSENFINEVTQAAGVGEYAVQSRALGDFAPLPEIGPGKVHGVQLPPFTLNPTLDRVKQEMARLRQILPVGQNPLSHRAQRRALRQGLPLPSGPFNTVRAWAGPGISPEVEQGLRENELFQLQNPPGGGA